MQYLLDEKEFEVHTRMKEDKEINLKAVKQLLIDIENNDPRKSTYLEEKETCEFLLGLRDDRPLHDKRREKRKRDKETL
jgi:hypothetical protein